MCKIMDWSEARIINYTNLKVNTIQEQANTFFTWWNNLGDIQITTSGEYLEETILFGFQTEGGYIHSSELLYTDSQISYLLSENL